MPPGLGEAATGMSNALQGSKAALELVRTTSRAILTMAESPEAPTATAANAAVQAALTAIRSLIQSTLDDVGIYVLVIPIPKKGIGALLTANPNDDPESTEVRFPTGKLPAPARASRVYDQIMNPSSLYLGGNAHYTRTVAESLYDRGDENRPTFERNDRWVYCSILAGTEDLGAALSLGTSFERLFGQDSQSPVGRGEVSLVPTGVTGTMSPRGFRAVLRWDLVPLNRVLQSLGRATVTVTRFAVIRAKDWRIRSVSRIKDVFDTDELTVGMTGRFRSEVVAIVEYDGFTTQWTDPGELLEGVPTYYALSFETRYNADVGVDPKEETRSLGFQQFSAPVEMVRRTDRLPPRSRGQRPDWSRTGSISRTFPAIGSLFDLMLARIDETSRRAQSFTTINNNYLEFLDRQVDRYVEKAEELLRATTTLTNLASAMETLAGAHVRVATGEGPAQSVISDLMESFEGDDDQPVGKQPPPFVLGTEYTCGVFLLGVGPDVSGLTAIFEALFQGQDNDPVLEGIASIPTLVARAEEAAYAELAPLETPGPEGFNEDMSPRGDGTDAGCDPSTETPPTFNDRMEPT